MEHSKSGNKPQAGKTQQQKQSAKKVAPTTPKKK